MIWKVLGINENAINAASYTLEGKKNRTGSLLCPSDKDKKGKEPFICKLWYLELNQSANDI